MDERWDNDLGKHIKKVFDNYEDTAADEGWLLLREKYPEKAKRRIAGWIWLSSAAALLLIFLGIYLLRPDNDNGQQLAGNKKGVKHDTAAHIANNHNVDRPKDSAESADKNKGISKNTIPQNAIAKNPDTSINPASSHHINKVTAATTSNNIAGVKTGHKPQATLSAKTQNPPVNKPGALASAQSK